MSRKLIAFSLYGGKYRHLNWLLPLLPYTQHYCEPFGGSAAVLLNRKPSPVETYNDLDGEAVNFFRVLRDEGDALIESISLTPYSREEFVASINPPTEGLSNLDSARRFYVRVRQATNNLAQTATPGRWSYSITGSCSGMSKQVSAWINGIDKLKEVANRLLRIQMENLPALEVIKKYDTQDTLFYCDPPYPKESKNSKGYSLEMSNDGHIQLAEMLHNIQGKVAMSGYRCNLLDELYSDWNRVESPKKHRSSFFHSRHSNSASKRKREVLWTNYS